jgi:hypothetical protein
MRERLFGAADHAAAAVISDALTRPGTVSSVAVARDAQTRDTLLWIETAECGTYPLRFNNDALATLHSAIHEHEKVTDVEAFRHAAE